MARSKFPIQEKLASKVTKTKVLDIIHLHEVESMFQETGKVQHSQLFPRINRCGQQQAGALSTVYVHRFHLAAPPWVDCSIH
jgi:hypothetical protein